MFWRFCVFFGCKIQRKYKGFAAKIWRKSFCAKYFGCEIQREYKGFVAKNLLDFLAQKMFWLQKYKGNTKDLRPIVFWRNVSCAKKFWLEIQRKCKGFAAKIFCGKSFCAKMLLGAIYKGIQRIGGHRCFCGQFLFAQKILAAKYNGNAKEMRPKNWRDNIFLRKSFWLQNAK